MTVIKRHYGWRRENPDIRDFKYLTSFHPVTEPLKPLPDKIDLRPYCPPVYDQGPLGSCTANAIIAAYEYDLIRCNIPNPPVECPVAIEYPNLSRLFLYYNERLMEGTTQIDAGAVIRDGIKSIAKLGCCKEEIWPYQIAKFRDRPADEAYVEAQNHQAILYASVEESVLGIQIALSDGYPVIFGFTVYDSFESEEVARTGIMPMPGKEEKVVGGHAVVAVGYDIEKEQLIVRNSWGENFGDKGYFYMPFNYVHHLCRDFWVLKQVE